MDIPAVYRIDVVGKLDTACIPRLGGMTITVTGGKGQETWTSLEGELKDQGALAGVLATLSDNQFPILSVQFVV